MKKLSIKESARAVALETLINVFKNNSYSNITLNSRLNKVKLSQADTNLATKIVYGTIQYKILLEYQLKQLLKSKLTEKYLEPLLLMSLYQLIFLDKIPANAVLDEANKLAKAYGKSHSNGYKLVNGILRNFTRKGLVLPEVKQVGLVSYLSIKDSMPEWLVQYFIENWGEQRAETILASFNENAKNSLRISNLADRDKVLAELNEQGYEPVDSNLATNSVIVAHGGIAENSLFADGKVTIQDEAASLVADVFDLSGDEQVLDACSAPGGKTIQIAERLSTGSVTALDIHPKKLNLVKQNAERMGVASRIKTIALDAKKTNTFFSDQQFDRILVDAPCSGLGLLRRKPEIRYGKSQKDLENLQQIQLAILDSVSKVLAKKGELVYSTCTITHEEDEDVIEQFLADHPQFELLPFELPNISTETGMLKILPDSFGSDGFFIAKLKLRG